MATWKDAVRAATTTNITLSGTQTVDGVVLAVNDRVLVKNQTTASQNGLYAVASSAWSRTSDASTTIEPDMAVRVSEGTVNAHTEWVLTTQAPITVGTTALTYAPKQFALGVYTATTVAALQGLPGPFTAGDAALLEGYYAADDGGGGELSFDATTISSTQLLSATVSGATNAAPIQITTSAAHGLTNGQSVLITGVLGNTAANGTWLISSVTSTTFTLNGSSGNGAYTSGGTVGSVKITASAAHGLSSGQRAIITRNSVAGINATWLNIGVLSSTVFSIGTSTTPGSGGTFGDGGLSVPSNAADGRWIRTISYPLNPKWYGAVVDGSFDSNGLIYGTDDTGAWNAMMATIAGSSLPGKKKVHLPPGYMYLAGDALNGTHSVQIPTSVHIEGNGGGGVNGIGGTGNAGFLLPPFTRIVFCNNGTSSTGSGDARYSTLEDFNVHTVTPIVSNTTWQANYSMLGPNYTRAAYIMAGKPVPKGACVVKDNATVSLTGNSKTDGSGTNNDVMFRCNGSFSPSGASPSQFTSATVNDLGTTVADGAGSWTIESVPKDRGLFSGTSVKVGQRFTVPGDPRYVFEVTVAGTLAGDTTGNCGSSTAGWKGTGSPYIQAAPYMTFQDGTVGPATIRVFPTGVIMIHADECKIRHVVGMGGFGYGIHVEGGSLDNIAFGSGPMWAVADQFKIEDVRWWYAGGVHVHGAENNIGVIRGIDVDAPGEIQRSMTTLMGEGQACAWFRQQGKARVYDAYFGSGNSPGFVSDASGGTGTPGSPDMTQTTGFIEFFGCGAEGGAPGGSNLLLAENTLWVGSDLQQTNIETAQAMLIRADRTRRITAKETVSSKTTKLNLQQVLGSVLSLGQSVGGDFTGGSWVGWWTDKANTTQFFTDRSSYFTPSGWLAYGHGPNNGTLGIARVAVGVSYGDAKNTGKLLSDYPLGYPTLTFTGGSSHTIARDKGSWLTDGFAAGDTVVVSGTASNDGTYTVSTMNPPTDLVLTLTSGLATETISTHVSVYAPAGSGGQGVGLLTIFDGYFERTLNGSTGGKYHASDANMLDDTRLRYGKRLVGDSFPIPGATQALGTPRRCVVTTAGWRAPRWSSAIGSNYVTEDNALRLVEATVVRPQSSPAVFTTGSDRCWRLAFKHAAASGEPSWPASGDFTDNVGNRWIDMGPTAVIQPYEYVVENCQITTQSMVDANKSLATPADAIVQTTGTLTAVRTLTLSGAASGAQRVIDNQCNFAVKISPAAAGSDLTINGIASGKCARIYFDGSNWRRASADATP